MQLFSADATIFKKKNLTFIFAPENMKKTPSKVAHNWPRPFFSSTGLAAQTAQKQKSRTTKSPLMQDWVCRLGLYQRRGFLSLTYALTVPTSEDML